MAGRGRFALIFFVFLILEHASADVCRAGCSKASASGGFQKGTIYNYNLEGTTKVTLSGADRQETGVKLAAEVQVVGLGNCAQYLKVKSVKITGPDGTVNDDTANIVKPVRFTLEDGRVGSEICTDAQESRPSLNIKRAIISMLQTAINQNTETDVFGKCPTTITSQKDGGAIVVTKIRDLNRCMYREQGKHDILSFMNAKAQTGSNILDSSLRVEAVIKNGVPEKVESFENYLYLPFSVDSAGAKAFVTAKLVLKNTGKGTVPATVTTTKSLIFENPFPVVSERGSLSDIQLALKTVTQSLGTHVDGKSASVFGGLIRVLRISNKNDIQTVYSQIKGGSTAKDNSLSRRVFLDALFRTGTGDSIEVTIKLIQSKELSTLEQNLAILSLTTVVHVTPESIKAATSLLDVAGLPNIVYLGVGTLAGAYCRDHTCHGATSQDANIAALSNKLGAKIGNCKASTKEAENTIIYALKAVKNIHHIEDSIVDKLANCASDKTVKSRIRVSALETFISDPCTAKLQSTAITILKDKQQDSEIRIQAYLALINCPNKNVADEIRNVLKTETINQVGSFISSSLRNIRASTNPSREVAKKYFDDIETDFRFPIDVRKYSQNYELSYEHEMFGVGSFSDVNVIYSQNSYLPRSGSINLTAEVFGRNLNLVEFGFRQENLDKLFEEYFGPYGVFNTNTPQQSYNKVKQSGLNIMDKIKERMEKTRGKRSVLQATNAFGRQLKTDIAPYNGDLDLDLFVKILGSDTAFMSFGQTPEDMVYKIIDKVFDNIDSGVNDAKDISHEIRNHLLLMDIEAGYPTSLGVALKLNLEAVSASKIQFSSKIDFRQIFKDPKNAKIDIKVVPSANLEMSGSITFDADLLSAGLKVATTLHTSTGSHVVGKIVDGNAFDIHVGLPIDKQELISVNHEILFISRRKGHLDGETPLKFVGTNPLGYGGCFDQLSSAVALVFCGDVSYSWFPNKENKNAVSSTGFGPLRGPANFYIRLDKADGLQGFHINGHYNTKHENQRTFEIMMETQGTKTSRKVTFLTDLVNKPELRTFKMKFDSSVKKMEFEGGMINNAKEKVIMAKVIYDADEYSAKAGVNVASSRGHEIYKPILEVNIPNHNTKFAELSGTITRDSVGANDKKYTANKLCLKTEGFSLTLDGWWSVSPKNFQANIKVSEDQQYMTLVGKCSYEEKKLNTNWDFHNTFNPNIDFSMNYVGVNDEKLKSVSMSIVHGTDFKSKDNKISYSSTLKMNDVSSLPKLDVEYTEKFSYPLWNAKYDTNVDIKPKKFSGKFEAEVGKSHADFKGDYQYGMKNEKDFYGKLRAKVNDNGFESETNFKVTGEDKGQYTAKLEIYPGEKHEASGVISYRVVPEDVNVGLDVKYKRSGKREEYLFNSACIVNPKLLNIFNKFSVGTVNYLDNSIKITRGKVSSGNMKVFVKDFVSGDGQFKFNTNDNKGNILGVVEMLKTKRKIKVDGNFLVAKPQYNGNVDLYYDFEKDNKKKITFTTTNKFQKDSVDTKNTLTMVDQKIEYTFKGECPGTFSNGKQNGQMTLTHSNGKSATLKFDREIKTDKKIIIGHLDSQLTYVHEKNGKPYKFIRKSKINTQDDYEYDDQFTFVKPSGEDLNYKILLKQHKAEKRVYGEGKVEISGALAPNAINSHMTSDYDEDLDDSNGDLKYRLKGSYGAKTTIDASGVIVYAAQSDKDMKLQNDMDVTLTFPLEKAQNVKFTAKQYAFAQKDGKNVEIKTNLNALVNAEAYKYDFDFNLNNDGNDKTNVVGKLFAQVPKHDKFVLDGNYEFKKAADDRRHCKGITNVEYGKNQKLSVNFENTRIPGKEGNSKMTIGLPSDYKDAKKIISESSYKFPNSNSFIYESKLDVDGKKYTLESTVDFTSKDNPMIEIKGTRSGAKPYRFLVKGNALDKDVVEGVVKVENIGDFNLDMNVNAKVLSPEEFNVKLYIDCEKMKLNKVQVDATSESLNKGVKKIQLAATENGKNLLSGSSTYQTRNEGGKFIMEGTGSFKVKDQPKSTSFKYIRDKISGGGEIGDEVMFSVAVGEKSGVIEYKQTNLIYKFFSTYCEEKKQCAHINVLNKIEGSVKSRIIEDFQVSVDLRKLGFVPEFGLQSHTELEELRVPIHTFDMHLNLEKSKYHVQVYAKPINTNYATAFTISLPRRIVSLESTTTYSDLSTKTPMFPFEHELVFYTNKNVDPSAKSVFKVSLNKDHVPNKILNLNGLILLTSPAIGKDLRIVGKSSYDIKAYSSSFDVVLDIFKKPQQKIVVSGKFKPIIEKETVQGSSEFNINAEGLGFDVKVGESLFLSASEFKVESKWALTLDRKKKEASALIHLTPKKQKIYARVPSTELISLDSTVNTDKAGFVQLETIVNVYQGKPCIFSSEFYSSPHYGFKISSKEQGGSNHVMLAGHLEMSKMIEIKMDHIEGGKTRPLVRLSAKLDGGGMKPENNFNSENIKHLSKITNTRAQDFIKSVQNSNKQIKQEVEKDTKRIIEHLKEGSHDTKPIVSYYKGELENVRTDLENDKALQQYIKQFNEYMKTVMKVMSDVMDKAVLITEQSAHLTADVVQKVTKIINENILPEVSALYDRLSSAVFTLLQAFVDILTQYVAIVSTFLEKHAADFKPLMENLESIFNDMTKIFNKKSTEFVKALETFWNELNEQIESLPLTSIIKEKIDDFKLPENLVNTVKTIQDAMKLILPSQLHDLNDMIANYVIKKINKEECDDVEEMKKIVNKYVESVSNLKEHLQVQFNGDDALPFFKLFAPAPINYKVFTTKTPTPPAFSTYNYIMKGRYPTGNEIIKALRPRSLNMMEIIPPYKLIGIIAGGQHIFTYDGRHITYPGSCKYVVSQDAVDGNFSIVLNLEKGSPKSIILVDKSGSEVEVDTKGQLNLGGSPHGFPLTKADTTAWKYKDSFTIQSKYGAKVTCTMSLDLCKFEISGFYLGKLRGLLGDGNNEPYDDFRLPNGIITTSESEFGSAYGLTSCPKIKTVDHTLHAGHHGTSDICTKFFEKSSLGICKFHVDISNYKQACEHATVGLSGEKAEKEACLIARAYKAACKPSLFPIMLPKECNKCVVDGVTYQYEEEFTVKHPQKQADIIVAVETTKANEKTYKDLVVPLISQIVDELKGKKIDDVKVYLVGVSPKMRYPIQYDIQNNKLGGAKIVFKDEQRSSKWESPITTDNEKVDKMLSNLAVFLQKAEIELGVNNIQMTYARMGSIAVRPKAVKTLIMVHSEPCAEAYVPFIQWIGAEISEQILTDRGIVAHLITPMELKSGKAANIVGFNANYVFVLGDKKRGLSNANLRSGLTYSEDVCAPRAQESNGNVYSSSKFNSGNKKVYINLLSNTIVDSLTAVSSEYECECDLDLLDGLKSKVLCSSTSRKDNRKPASKKK